MIGDKMSPIADCFVVSSSGEKPVAPAPKNPPVYTALPLDIWKKIFSHAVHDQLTLDRLRLTCKSFQAICGKLVPRYYQMFTLACKVGNAPQVAELLSKCNPLANGYEPFLQALMHKQEGVIETLLQDERVIEDKLLKTAHTRKNILQYLTAQITLIPKQITRDQSILDSADFIEFIQSTKDLNNFNSRLKEFNIMTLFSSIEGYGFKITNKKLNVFIRYLEDNKEILKAFLINRDVQESLTVPNHGKVVEKLFLKAIELHLPKTFDCLLSYFFKSASAETGIASRKLDESHKTKLWKTMLIWAAVFNRSDLFNKLLPEEVLSKMGPVMQIRKQLRKHEHTAHIDHLGVLFNDQKTFEILNENGGLENLCQLMVGKEGKLTEQESELFEKVVKYLGYYVCTAGVTRELGDFRNLAIILSSRIGKPIIKILKKVERDDNQTINQMRSSPGYLDDAVNSMMEKVGYKDVNLLEFAKQGSLENFRLLVGGFKSNPYISLVSDLKNALLEAAKNGHLNILNYIDSIVQEKKSTPSEWQLFNFNLDDVNVSFAVEKAFLNGHLEVFNFFKQRSSPESTTLFLVNMTKKGYFQFMQNFIHEETNLNTIQAVLTPLRSSQFVQTKSPLTEVELPSSENLHLEQSEENKEIISSNLFYWLFNSILKENPVDAKKLMEPIPDEAVKIAMTAYRKEDLNMFKTVVEYLKPLIEKSELRSELVEKIREGGKEAFIQIIGTIVGKRPHETDKEEMNHLQQDLKRKK